MKSHANQQKGKSPLVSLSDPIDKEFCIRFLTTNPIIVQKRVNTGDAEKIECEPQVKENPSFTERHVFHNGDFADIYMAGDNKPIANISEERIAFLINCANNTDKPCSEEEITNAIMSFRKACGNDSQVEVLHLSPGESVTNAMGRTACVYDPQAVQKVLTKKENEQAFKNAKIPITNTDEFIHYISTVWVKQDEHPELQRIIEQELFSGHEHGRFTNDLYNSLGMPMKAPDPPLLHPGQAMYRAPDSPAWDIMERDAVLSGLVTGLKNQIQATSAHENQIKFKTIISLGNSAQIQEAASLLKKDASTSTKSVERESLDRDQGIPKTKEVAFFSPPRQTRYQLQFGQEINITQKEEGVALDDILVSPVPNAQMHGYASGLEQQPEKTSGPEQEVQPESSMPGQATKATAAPEAHSELRRSSPVQTPSSPPPETIGTRAQVDSPAIRESAHPASAAPRRSKARQLLDAAKAGRMKEVAKSVGRKVASPFRGCINHR